MPANPVIAFIGAGSTVFMKNIIGDVLQRPALAGAEIRLMDIDPKRLADSEVVAKKIASTLGVAATRQDLHRPAQGARRRRLRRRRLPDRRLRARDRHRLRGAEDVRPAPDHRRHPRHRRHHARPPHRAAPLEDLRGHDRGLPRRDHAAIRQPDGDQHLGDRREIPAASARSASATRCRAPPRSWRATSTSRSRKSATAAPASTTWPSTSRFEEIMDGRQLPRPLPRAAAAATPRAASPSPTTWNPRCPNRVRYEMMMRLGYFVTESSEHFAEYVPWFIKRDRPDLIEKFGIPLDEYPQRCIENVARWAKQAERVPRRQDHRGQGQPRIRLRDHQLGLDRHAVGDLRQRAEPRADHLAARGLRRRGALPRRPQRHPADPHRQAAAAARRADAHQHQRPGADGRGADRGEPRAHLSRRDARPAHRRRARPRPDLAAHRRARSRATATGCRRGRGQRARARPPSRWRRGRRASSSSAAARRAG